MFRFILLLILLRSAVPTIAQTDSTWTTEVRGTVSFTQVGFHRWHDGGVSSLALGTGIHAQAAKPFGENQQEHEIRLAFGVVKQDGIELRKSDDLIHLRSAFNFSGIPIFGRLSPAITLDLRSQFADGFQYNETDEGLDALQISGFLSPATLTESIGLDYPARSWLNLRLGIAAKQTIVTIHSLRSRYKVSSNSVFRWQMGTAGLFIFDRTIFPNVDLKSTLTLFLAFNQASPDTIWETLLTMKVNSWLQVNAEYTALFDRDLSRYIQRKQSLAAGISFRIL